MPALAAENKSGIDACKQTLSVALCIATKGGMPCACRFGADNARKITGEMIYEILSQYF